VIGNDRAPLFVVLVTAACAVMARCDARADDGLELARLSVHEAGFDATSEPAAIYATAVSEGARAGMTWPRWLRAHSHRFARHQVSRAWVYRLHRDGRDPRAGIDWRRYRPRWLAMLAAADAAITSPPVCIARTWGSDADAERVRRLRLPLVEVGCGNTRNHFFARRAR
jgi:hypothetical protein